MDPARDESNEERLRRRERRSLLRQAFGTKLLFTFAIVLTLTTTVVLGMVAFVMRNTNYRVMEQRVARHLESVSRLAASALDRPFYLNAFRPGEQADPDAQRVAREALHGICARLKEQARVNEVVLFTGAPPDLTVIASSEEGDAEHELALSRLLTDSPAIALARRVQREGTLVDGGTLDLTKALYDREARTFRVEREGRIQTLARGDLTALRIDARPVSSSLYYEPIADAEGGGWRFLKSAYAPIVDEDGEVRALVGVELPAHFASAVNEVESTFKTLAVAAGMIVLTMAVLLIRHRVHLPIYRLVRAMQGEEGVPTHARVRYRDEIGILTEHYNDMVDRLIEKDQKLRELYDQARETAVYLKGYSNHLVAGVPSGVVAVDTAGRLTVWNPSAARILRRSHKVGTIVWEVLGEDHPLARALRAALAGSVTDQALMVLDLTSGEGPIPTALDDASASGEAPLPSSLDDDESQRLVELTCAPFRGEQGELLGAAALITDRTELERFRRVASRNERLAAIGDLGAGLAHEIKNPLGAISGFAELIERKEGQDAARLAKRLRGEVEELNAFLNKFLGFAREDKLKREPTDLDALVIRSAELGLGDALDPGVIAAALEGQPVELRSGTTLRVRLELAGDLPPLALDAALLRPAVVNLVRNAVQAMSKDGGELTLRTHRVENVVFVRVRDQGPGIPTENRERIFDPLFTTRAEGTGLGLAICNKTVTAHGGKLSVRDAPGGGAEFVIRLPLIAAAIKPAGARVAD